MSNIRKTFGHAGIYGIGVLLNRAVSFIMLPIYTRFLTPSDYGTLELAEVIVEVASIVAGGGILNGMSKFYYKYDTEDDQNEVISTMFLIVLSSYFILCASGSLISGNLSSLVFGSEKNHFIIFLSFLNLFFSMLTFVPFAYLRTKNKSIVFVIVSSIKLIMQLSLNILFVVNMKLGVLGVLYSTCISSFSVGLFLAVYTFREVSCRFSNEKAKEILLFGYPFIATGFGAFILTFSDRFFLNKYCDIASVGIYSLGYKFGFLLAAFPINPLFQVWQVQRFEIVKSPSFTNDFNKFLNWFSIITISVALFIALTVSQILIIISDKAFWGASSIVPIILLAYYFQACTDYFNFGIFHTGKSKYLAYATLLSAFSIITMSFFFIPSYGIYGGAWATLAAFFIRLLYVYLVSQRLFYIRYNLAKSLQLILISILFFLSNELIKSFLGHVNVFASLLVSLSLFALYLLLITATGIIEKTERDALKEIVLRRFGSFKEARS